jgi:hypothetical protein
VTTGFQHDRAALSAEGLLFSQTALAGSAQPASGRKPVAAYLGSWPQAVKALGCLFLVANLVFFFFSTIHWPLVGDAALMHYVAFLMDRGLRPYAQIRDMNFPGSYIPDWLAMHLLGPGALGWRIFDLLLGVGAIAAMVSIAGRGNRFAGFWAGALLVLLHGRDGMGQTGQRDFTITVLLLWSYYFARRVKADSASTGRLLRCYAAAVLAGAALTIKPTAIFFVPVLMMASAPAGRRLRAKVAITWGAGLMTAALAAVVLLVRMHALSAFFKVESTLLAYHTSLARNSLVKIFKPNVMPSSFGMLFLLCCVLFLLQRGWRRPDLRLLALACLAGYLAFYVQQGFLYQRYPCFAFLLLLLGMLCSEAMARTGAIRALAVFSIFFGLWIAPAYAWLASKDVWHETALIGSLQRDLQPLGGKNLSGDIQCIDTVSGCINTLYDLRLLPATGEMYDEYMFGRNLPPAILLERRHFLSELRATPPKVLVVTSSLFFGQVPDYGKLPLWPEFQALLASHYTLQTQRQFPGGMTGPLGYRIYLLSAPAGPATSADSLPQSPPPTEQRALQASTPK